SIPVGIEGVQPYYDGYYFVLVKKNPHFLLKTSTRCSQSYEILCTS
ncbi:1501_t:CDS:1, partial [Funneliformis mosseae]